MVDGFGVGPAGAGAAPVPTAGGAAAGVVGTAGVVPLGKTGAGDGATTLEVVTGLTMVHGQLVMVKVWLAVAV